MLHSHATRDLTVCSFCPSSLTMEPNHIITILIANVILSTPTIGNQRTAHTMTRKNNAFILSDEFCGKLEIQTKERTLTLVRYCANRYETSMTPLRIHLFFLAFKTVVLLTHICTSHCQHQVERAVWQVHHCL